MGMKWVLAGLAVFVPVVGATEPEPWETKVEVVAGARFAPNMWLRPEDMKACFENPKLGGEVGGGLPEACKASIDLGEHIPVRPGEHVTVEWTPSGKSKVESTALVQIEVLSGPQAGRSGYIDPDNLASPKERAARIRADRSAPIEATWTCSRDDRRGRAMGRITNRTASQLHNLVATVTFENSLGQIQGMGKALIDSSVLDPGESTTFEVGAEVEWASECTLSVRPAGGAQLRLTNDRIDIRR